MNDKKAKQPDWWDGESFSGLDRRSNQPQHSLEPKPNLEQGPNSAFKAERSEKAAVEKFEASRGWFMRFEKISCFYNIRVQGEAAVPV